MGSAPGGAGFLTGYGPDCKRADLPETAVHRERRGTKPFDPKDGQGEKAGGPPPGGEKGESLGMHIAIVDDAREDAGRLEAFLDRYQRETGTAIQVSTFTASVDFLEEFHGDYDIIFLDIEMPGSDGLEVAHEIRRKDETAAIVFITNMAQYAIRGYEVNAVDFMVKPVGYFNFVQKLEKAMRAAEKRGAQFLMLSNGDGLYRIPASDVLYIEKDRNYLVYHTRQGVFQARGTMQEARERLRGQPFSECSSGCLVNLDRVERIGKDFVLAAGAELPLSRRMKKAFTQDYMDFLGGG